MYFSTISSPDQVNVQKVKMRLDCSLKNRHARKIIKIAKPRFEPVTGDSSRASCMHADEARAKSASITSRRVIMRQ